MCVYVCERDDSGGKGGLKSCWIEKERKRLTEPLGWLIRHRHLTHNRPLLIALQTLRVIVNTVRDARLGQPLAEIARQGLPRGEGLLPAPQEQLDLDAELQR